MNNFKFFLSFRTALLVLAVSILISNHSFSQVPGPDSSAIYQTVSFLSSRELLGRAPGQYGYNKAAEYFSNKFSELGLTPLGDESFYQNFFIESNKIVGNPSFSSFVNGIKKEYRLSKDYIFRGFTGSGKIESAGLAFCGYGISRPEIGYDDYANIDVRNKVVIVFKQNPSWKIDNNSWGNGYPREKSIIAKNHGAIGIIFVSLPNSINPQAPIGSVLHGEGIQPEDFPQIQIDLSISEDFFKDSGFDIKSLQSLIDSTQSPHSTELKTKVEIDVKAEYIPKAPTKNIVGVLPGNDNTLKDEYIVIGAHLDHVGQQGDSLYFPGANDNASGCAALLESAKILSNKSIKTDRSIVFVIFSGEEQGLLGSDYFVKNLPIPSDKIIAMLNFDCIASGDSLQLGNGKSSPILWSIAKGVDKELKNLSISNTWSGGGADATAFHNVGIPCLYFVSYYSYTHLHKISDNSENVNYSLLTYITKVATNTIIKISGKEYQKEKVY